MFEWIKESLTVGNATVKYPFAPLELIPDSRGKPEHDALACIVCGACATACPPNALQMHLDLPNNNYIWQINYGRCIFCGRCEEVCPVKAIELTQEFELAVMSKDDMLETATYSLQRCALCNKQYAPSKEIDYLNSLLDSFAQNDEEVQRAKEQLSICPQCRRIAESANVKFICEQLERRA
ncbi:MAG: 4Fe-4S dicluster domain-containing protein [Coriobacteriales bacterium]|jgi:hydrogenase-4 component H|nr:4Fe-4S dicluster domain-containing protein [Coriobacteriales bacterium]